MVETKTEVFREINVREADLRRFGVRRLGLFGSFVREEQSRGSDLDFLVEFEPGKKSFNNFMDLAFFLEDIFDRKVDLLTIESLSPYIGPRILNEVEYAISG